MTVSGWIYRAVGKEITGGRSSISSFVVCTGARQNMSTSGAEESPLWLLPAPGEGEGAAGREQSCLPSTDPHPSLLETPGSSEEQGKCFPSVSTAGMPIYRWDARPPQTAIRHRGGGCGKARVGTGVASRPSDRPCAGTCGGQTINPEGSFGPCTPRK